MSNKIIKTYNGTIVVPYKNGMLKQLQRDTSSYDNVYHKVIEVTGFQMPYKNQNAFITHNQDSMFLQNLLPTYTIQNMKMNKVIHIDNEFHLNSDINPTDIQYDIINHIKSEIDKNYRAQKEWFINVQTGFGKTLMSVYLASIIGYKTLIMCFSSEILDQWANTISQKTDFDMSRLIQISDGKLLDLIYNNEFDVTRYDIFMCTPKLLSAYAKKHGIEKLETIFNNIGIGLKIYDEAHRNKANIVKINAATNVKYTLYLSADYGQSDRTEEIMYYKIFKNCEILAPSDEQKTDMRYTIAVIVEYNSNPSLLESESIYNRYGFSPQFYMDYQFNKGYIFKVIEYVLQTIIKANDSNHKILLLFKNINHVDIIYDKLKESYGDKYQIGRFYSTLSPEEKEFTKSSANIIVSTYQSFGTGIDIADIKYVISSNQCSKIEDNQAAGRARPMKDGSNAFYFMLSDRGFKYCTKKLKIRLAYLNETKIKNVIKLKYEI